MTPTPPQAGGRKPQPEPRCTCPRDRDGLLDVLLSCPEHGPALVGGTGVGGQPPTHSLTATERQLVERCGRWQDEWAKGLLAIIDRLTAADAPCTTGATPTLLPSAMAGAFAEWCRDVQPAGKPEWLNGAGAAWAFLYPKLNEALRREHDSAAAGAADPARRQQTPRKQQPSSLSTAGVGDYDATKPHEPVQQQGVDKASTQGSADKSGPTNPGRQPLQSTADHFGDVTEMIPQDTRGDAPPRPPQGRRQQQEQGAGAVPGELQPKSPPASPAPPAAQGAPTQGRQEAP